MAFWKKSSGHTGPKVGIFNNILLEQAFFLTKIEKTQGGKNSPNLITQDNFSQKTQLNGSIVAVAQKTQRIGTDFT